MLDLGLAQDVFSLVRQKGFTCFLAGFNCFGSEWLPKIHRITVAHFCCWIFCICKGTRFWQLSLALLLSSLLCTVTFSSVFVCFFKLKIFLRCKMLSVALQMKNAEDNLIDKSLFKGLCIRRSIWTHRLQSLIPSLKHTDVREEIWKKIRIKTLQNFKSVSMTVKEIQAGHQMLNMTAGWTLVSLSKTERHQTKNGMWTLHTDVYWEQPI